MADAAIEVVAGVIIRDGSVLLAKRPANKPPVGWEFPGGKVEFGESLSEALKREFCEELNADISVGTELYQTCGHGIKLHFIQAFMKPSSSLEPQEEQSINWFPLDGTMPDGLLKLDYEFWNFLVRSQKST